MIRWGNTDNSVTERVMDMCIQPKSTFGLYETPLLHQTSFWSTVKHKQGIQSKAYDIKIRSSDIGRESPETYAVDDLLVLFQQIGAHQMIGYVPYGPSIRPEDEHIGGFLEELSESLREHLPESCIFLRYDLPWESPWAHEEDTYDEEGRWLGPPEPDLQELRLNWGTQQRNIHKATTDILPSDTVLVDLRGDEESILESMKPKTRYNIRTAIRHGVSVRRGSIEDIGIFYDLYAQTCRRNCIVLHQRTFFEAMFATHDARGPALDSSTDFELLIAEDGGFPLAALFLVYSSTQATYLFGASSSERRNLMGTYALQWEAIRRSKARGCTTYDLFGTAPTDDPSHPMHGLYRFKTGFSDLSFHRMGCWDYPFEQDDYQRFSTQEMVSQGYHLSR